MLDDNLELDWSTDDDIQESDDKDKRRLLARRKLEERLEEKRLREEIFDDFYSF